MKAAAPTNEQVPNTTTSAPPPPPSYIIFQKHYENQGWQSESAIWNSESAFFLHKLSGIQICSFSADSCKNPKPVIRDILCSLLIFYYIIGGQKFTYSILFLFFYLAF